jgi:hypothetical protein
MKQDHFAMPSAVYEPPDMCKPCRRVSFTVECVQWGLALAACGVALAAVLFMLESTVSP